MNGDTDIALSEALRRCQHASKVISPFIIFAVFDVRPLPLNAPLLPLPSPPPPALLPFPSRREAAPLEGGSGGFSPGEIFEI